MSCVTNAILTVPTGTAIRKPNGEVIHSGCVELWDYLNEYVRSASYGDQSFVWLDDERVYPIGRPHYGGRCVLESDVGVAAFNHTCSRTLIEALSQIDWIVIYDEKVQLMHCDQDRDHFTLTTIAEARP